MSLALVLLFAMAGLSLFFLNFVLMGRCQRRQNVGDGWRGGGGVVFPTTSHTLYESYHMVELSSILN